MKHIILIMALTINIPAVFGQNTVPEVSSGKIIRHQDFPSRYVTDRTIDVWLPDGYTDDQDHAVLYMHDGQMLFDAKVTWNKQEWDVDGIMHRLLDSLSIRKTIVVGIHNISEERHSDYFPQKPFENLSKKSQDSLLMGKRGEGNLFPKPIGSDNYLRFIVEEVKPFIDKEYSVKKGRNDTYIAGSSMGGLISWYALCEYPEVFGGAACLSTHWPGIFTVENNPVPNAFFDYLGQNLPDPETHKLYFDYGTETLDSLYGPLQSKADELMKEKGFAEGNWKTLKFEGEDHSENAWKKRFDISLTFLLGNQAR